MNKVITVNCKRYFDMIREGFLDAPVGSIVIDDDVYHQMIAPGEFVPAIWLGPTNE